MYDRYELKPITDFFKENAMNEIKQQFIVAPKSVQMNEPLSKGLRVSKDSPFSNGYNISAEAELLGEKISQKIADDDIDFARWSVFQTHLSALEEFLKNKHNYKRLPKYGEYQIYPNEQALFNSLPSLKNRETDKIELQTRHAFRLWIGGDSHKKFFQPGVRQSMRWVRQIQEEAIKLNPYAEAYLVVIEKRIQGASDYLESCTAVARSHFSELAKSGIKLAMATSPEPILIDVGHVRYYGFSLLKLLKDFDEFVCAALSLTYKGIIPNKEANKMMENAAHEIRSLCHEIFLSNRKVIAMSGLTREALQDEVRQKAMLTFVDDGTLVPLPSGVISFNVSPSLLALKQTMNKKEAIQLEKRLSKLGLSE